MFVVSEAEAAAIRTAFDHGGELSAAVELRRLFPAITDNAAARECARTIAAWKPLPVRRVSRSRKGRQDGFASQSGSRDGIKPTELVRRVTVAGPTPNARRPAMTRPGRADGIGGTTCGPV